MPAVSLKEKQERPLSCSDACKRDEGQCELLLKGAHARLPELRALARRLRPEQCGADWDAIRKYVACLILDLIHAHSHDSEIVDLGPAVKPATLVPLDASTAALHVDKCLYLVEAAQSWTSLGDDATWSDPIHPQITMVGMNAARKPLH